MLTTLHWVLLASLFLPFLTLLGILLIVRRSRSPVSDKLPQPAGESLRTRLEELDEKAHGTVASLPFFFVHSACRTGRFLSRKDSPTDEQIRKLYENGKLPFQQTY
jgi:hypothetical protein